MELAAIFLSILSLLLAIISFVVSFKSQRLQNRVNIIELKLKQYELDAKEKEQQKVPLVEARIVHVIKNEYKIKVWNSGNGIARSVSALWEPTDGIIFTAFELSDAFDAIGEKTPLLRDRSSTLHSSR